MTRTETIKLLEFLKGCYPNVRIDDAPGMVDAWLLAFSDKKAKEVYQAARLHMQNCKFFPTPADIIQNINRAKILFDDKPGLPQGTPGNRLTSGQDIQKTDEEMLQLWAWICSDT